MTSGVTIQRLIQEVLWVFGCMMIVGGCQIEPKPALVAEEPVVFVHADEVIKGSGPHEGYWALADRRVFAVMAFLNAVGYDREVAGVSMHPIRTKVRQMVGENLASAGETLKKYRTYYDKHRLAANQYLNFGLSLSADYPFRRIRAGRELIFPWTDWMLADLPEVLNDFWVNADLEGVWAACAADYRRELEICDPETTAHGIESVWEYLRMPRSDSYTIVRVSNPLIRHFTASGHRFESYFYSLEGPGAGGYIHEYLHTIINDLVEEHHEGQRDKLMRYFEAGKDAEISASYQQLTGWVSECMVHAICHRLTVLGSDAAVAERVEKRLRSLTEGGYRLLGPIYEQLAAYERSGKAFDHYLPTLLAELEEFQGEERPEKTMQMDAPTE